MTAQTDIAALLEPIKQALPRKLLDVACRIRAGESLFRDDELVDEAAHALKEAIAAIEAMAAERDALRAAVLFALPLAEEEWGGGRGHNTIGEQAIELLRDASRTQEPT